MLDKDNEILTTIDKMTLMDDLATLNRQLKERLDKHETTSRSHPMLMAKQLYHANEIVLGIHGEVYWYLPTYYVGAMLHVHFDSDFLDDDLFVAIKKKLAQLKELDLGVMAGE